MSRSTSAQASQTWARAATRQENEVTSRHRSREKENDQGEGSLTIHDHSTTRGRRLELVDVLAVSVAVVKLLPGLLLGVASTFSQPGIFRRLQFLPAGCCCRGRDGFLLKGGASKIGLLSGYMEGKHCQYSSPSQRKRR